MSRRHEVSFIDAEVQKWLAEQSPENGLCLGRFHADLEVEDLRNMTPGTILAISGSRYEIAETGKRCFGECRFLRETGKKCPLAEGVAFGRRLADEE